MKRAFFLLILPVLVLLPMVIEKVGAINSSKLTVEVSAVATLFGLIAGLILLLLKHGQKFFWIRLLLVLSIVGLVCGYVDFLVFSNIKIIHYFGIQNGERPFIGVALLGFLSISIVASLFFLLWRYLDKTTEFLVVLFSVTLLLSTFYLPQATANNFDDTGALNDPAAGSDKLTIYIILDSMIGSAGLRTGIPENATLADEIDGFFRTYGFHHFEKAFSRHVWTTKSIPTMLNGMSKGIPVAAAKVVSKNNQSAIIENKLFDRLHEDHRRIHVYQTQYISFCGHKAVVKCRTISTSNPYSPHMENGLPPHSDFLAAFFRFESALKSSFVMKSIIPALFKPVHAGTRKVWPMKYRYAKTPTSYTDLTFNSWFQAFSDEVTSSKGGVYFAHFLMPHHPYRLDADCKPVWERFSETDFGQLIEIHGMTRDKAEQKRLDLYSEYRDHVRCVYRKLSAFFDRLQELGRYDSAHITLIGDHGSRISNAFNLELSSDRDMIDNHSALFSVKKPTGTAKTDPRVISVQQLLLAHAMENPESHMNDVTKTVVLSSSNDRNFHTVPMPDF